MRVDLEHVTEGAMTLFGAETFLPSAVKAAKLAVLSDEDEFCGSSFSVELDHPFLVGNMGDSKILSVIVAHRSAPRGQLAALSVSRDTGPRFSWLWQRIMHERRWQMAGASRSEGQF